MRMSEQIIAHFNALNPIIPTPYLIQQDEDNMERILTAKKDIHSAKIERMAVKLRKLLTKQPNLIDHLLNDKSELMVDFRRLYPNFINKYKIDL